MVGGVELVGVVGFRLRVVFFGEFFACFTNWLVLGIFLSVRFSRCVDVIEYIKYVSV